MCVDHHINVIIPYSPEHTPEWMLERAKSSVQNQTYPAESIVVEGGPNPAWARNRGMEKSDSRFIAFLDSDDYWKQTKLEKQYETITAEEAALCINTAKKTDGSKTDVAAQSAEEFAILIFCGGLTNITSSMLIDTKRTTAMFDESIYRKEDHLFALEVVNDGGYCYVDDVLTYVKKHEQGVSMNTDYDRKIESYRQFYERAIDLFPGLKEYADDYWAQAWYVTGRGYYHKNDFESSLSYLQRSFATKPRFRTGAALGLTTIYYILSKINRVR